MHLSGKQLKNLVLCIFMLLMVNLASADVVVFRDYSTKSVLDRDMLHISRAITLENVGANPIIPGELHFKLHEIIKNQKVASVVHNLEAKNDFGTVLKSRIIESKEETDLVASVWEPVLPKFTYNVKMSYDLEFKTKGILFYEINVPLEETTIPIENQKQSLYIPAKYHITYAPDAIVRTVEEGGQKYRVVEWENMEDMVVEYSVLPLPKLGIRSVNIFWIMVIIILLASTFFIHRKLRNG